MPLDLDTAQGADDTIIFGVGGILRLGQDDALVLGSHFELLDAPEPDPLVLGAPTHLGPRGRDGGTYAAAAGDPLPVLTVTYLDDDGLARRASSADLATAVRAVAVTTNSASPGQQVGLAGQGVEVEHDLALPSGPAYLGVDGEITTDRDTGVVRLRVGTLSPGRLIVSLQPTIRHAQQQRSI